MSDERQASERARMLVEKCDLQLFRADVRDELLAYIATLEADRARLDRLERSGADVMHYDASEYPEHWTIDTGNLQEYDGEGFTLREAIDAALSSSPLAPTQEGAT